MDFSNFSDEKLSAFQNNFSAKLPLHASTVEVSTEVVNETKVDNDAFDYSMDMQNQIKNHGKDWTAYKNLLRDKEGTEDVGQFPV